MYNYQFTDPRIEEYFYNNVINPNRMSVKNCITKGLPYVDDKGDLRNTHAFMEVNRYYKENNHYPKHPPGSKEWRDFWIEREKRDRCTNGMWLGQVRVPKYFYFFLNYHFMTTGVEQSDGSKNEVYTLPSFWKIHFEFFHLLEYCERNGLDLALIKPRGCGLTECAAGLNEIDYFVPKVNPKTGKPDSFASNQIIAEDTAYLKGEGKIFDLIVASIDKINSFGRTHGMYKPAGVTRKESNQMHLVPGYITEGGKGEPVQTGGSIEAKAMKKADKGVGGRKSKFMLEECNFEETEVIMYDGSVKMLKELTVGDLLMGLDSTPREVLEINKGYSKLLTVKNYKNETISIVTPDHTLHTVNVDEDKTTWVENKKAKYFLNLGYNYHDNFIKRKNTNAIVLEKFKVVDENIEDNYIGIKLSGDHLFLLANNYVEHNCGVFQELGGILKKIKPNTIRRSNHGDVKTGNILMWGTSNTDTRGTESFRAVLKNPDLYGCTKFRNIHATAKDSVEKVEALPKFSFEYMIHHTSDEKGVGWFIPYYDSYYMDEDGNPLREKSYLAIKESRKKAMELAKEDVDKENLMKEIADHPITMEEALLVSKGRYFTNPMVSRQLVNLETGIIESSLIKGDLVFERNTSGEIIGVLWYDNPNGLIQILEHPEWAKKDKKGRHVVRLDEDRPWRLYIAGIDSVDQGIDDSAGSGSNLGCVIKKRRPVENALSATNPETYIGLYNHRSHNVKHDYENILKLLLYFNAQALLEYTKVRIRDYIVDEMGFSKYLAYEPDLSHTINSFKRKKLKKGIRVTKEIILFYLGLISEYIDESCEKILIRDLLEQIANYTYEEKGSYDLIAAMGMCEILATEFRDKLPTKVHNEPRFESLRWHVDSNGRKVFSKVQTNQYAIDGKIVKYRDPKTGFVHFEN